MDFLKRLKIAVINEDKKTLKKLAEEKYEYSSIEEANEMLQYISKAKHILEKEKSVLLSQMNEIKKLKKFNQNSGKNGMEFKI